jgi:hypothetical protein
MARMLPNAKLAYDWTDMPEPRPNWNQALTAVVPGKPEESQLIARVTTTDPDLVMPPPETDRKLTAAQVELLTRWIQQGGEYKGHWSFIRPERLALPAISQENWAQIRSTVLSWQSSTKPV